MGKYDEALCSYLDDRERFADLFNGVCFGGEQIVHPEELENDSERYVEKVSSKREKGISRGRFRDVKKRLKSGGILRVLAVENQSEVDYTMPWRCMNYDDLEYGQQIRAIQRSNEAEQSYENAAERLCRFKRSDRLTPVYTLCLYHGQKEWDGPKNLYEMMDFGEEPGVWNQIFHNYSLNLFCVNEAADYRKFHSSLRELFMILPLRGNKKEMIKVLREQEEFRRLDRETMEVISVMTNNSVMLNYMEEYEDEEGRYDMCKAWDDWKEEGREEGREEGEERAMQLNMKLIKAGRVEDLERAAEDHDFRRQLFREFGL